MDVNTRKNLSQHKSSCCDTGDRKEAKILLRQGILCRDTDYCNLEKPVETERIRRRNTSIAIRKSMLRHFMKKFCRDKVMNVATLKDKFFGPDR